ncbi:MAG: metallophosphoesterase [Planctomycetes bacterium]|nr:metallophosphoesterase [Planctomycetota bacterium]
MIQASGHGGAVEHADRSAKAERAGATSLVRVAAVGDLHYTRTSQGLLERALGGDVLSRADVLVLCGDLTDYGLPEEARALAKDLSGVKLPIIAVLGNHDHESGQAEAVVEILRDTGGVTVLDGESCEVRGVGFAGAKGFGGGFGRRVLEPWGEPAIKRFVQDALDEALKLERALSRLRTRSRVAVLHYAPIKGTVEGESLEIYPFLGSSRLEEPINRFRASLVFHGHCHHGTPEGRTTAGIPVYNVALPVLRRTLSDGAPPVRLVELPADEADPRGQGGPARA